MRLGHFLLIVFSTFALACGGGGQLRVSGGAPAAGDGGPRLPSVAADSQEISYIQVSPDAVAGVDYIPNEILIGFAHELRGMKVDGKVFGFDPSGAVSFAPPNNPGLYQNAVHASFARYLAQEFGMTVVPNGEAYVEDLNYCTYRLPEGADAEDVARKIRLKYPSDVKYVQYNQLFYAMFEPDDPEYLNNNVWAMKKIEANVAWDTTAGSGATVAVIDSGIRTTHEDLTWIQPPGYILDIVNNDEIPNDEHGHGTHVCGTVGAIGNNGKGVIGVAWECDILPIKVLNSGGYATSGSIATGITLSRILEADVINMSLGSYSPDRATFEASIKAWDAGIVIVAAAGNDNTSNNYLYPGSYPHIINVGATINNDNRANYSNRGRTVDIAAPGGQGNGTGRIRSTSRNGFTNYTWMNGTSMASPHVAGAAALLIANDPTLTNNEVRGMLEGVGDDVLNQTDWRILNKIYRLNPAKALAASVSDFPSIAITSHIDGDSESADFTLVAEIDAPNGGAAVRWGMDGQILGFSTEAPWERAISVVGMIPGVHTFTAEVIDGANLHGYAMVEINIALPVTETPYWTNIQDAPHTDDWYSLNYNGAGAWQELEIEPGEKVLYFGDPDKDGGRGYYDNDTDALLSPNFDLAGLTSPFFKFEMAYELGAYMLLVLRVIDSSGRDDVIGYIGTTSGVTTNPSWPDLDQYEINLSNYEGNVARVEFWMQRYSQTVGLGEGVYLNNILVSESSAQPVVQLISPARNSLLYGEVDIVTNITDDKNLILKAELRNAQSGEVLQTLTEPPFTYALDTTLFADGFRGFQIAAYDEHSIMGYAQPSLASLTYVFHNTPVEFDEVSPSYGTIATPVTIAGTGFGEFYEGEAFPATYRQSYLYFTGEDGLVEADVSAETWTETEITTTVPEGAVTGPIYVVIGDIETQSPADFSVGELGDWVVLSPEPKALMPMNGSLWFEFAPQQFSSSVSFVCLDAEGNPTGIQIPAPDSLDELGFTLTTIPFPHNGKYTIRATAFAATGDIVADLDFWVEKLRGDFNGDRFVTMADLDFLRERLWTTPEDPEWILISTLTATA